MKFLAQPGPGSMALNPQWRGTPLPSVMPISAQALDAAAWNAVNNWYSGMQQWFVMKGF